MEGQLDVAETLTKERTAPESIPSVSVGIYVRIKDNSYQVTADNVC